MRLDSYFFQVQLFILFFPYARAQWRHSSVFLSKRNATYSSVFSDKLAHEFQISSAYAFNCCVMTQILSINVRLRKVVMFTFKITASLISSPEKKSNLALGIPRRLFRISQYPNKRHKLHGADYERGNK